MICPSQVVVWVEPKSHSCSSMPQDLAIQRSSFWVLIQRSIWFEFGVWTKTEFNLSSWLPGGTMTRSDILIIPKTSRNHCGGAKT